MKTQKGITLIALIITIIVMLILVGVSVSVALNTGLFKTAQGVAKNTQDSRNAEITLSSGQVEIGDAVYESLDAYVKGEAPIKQSATVLKRGDTVSYEQTFTDNWPTVSEWKVLSNRDGTVTLYGLMTIDDYHNYLSTGEQMPTTFVSGNEVSLLSNIELVTDYFEFLEKLVGHSNYLNTEAELDEGMYKLRQEAAEALNEVGFPDNYVFECKGIDWDIDPYGLDVYAWQIPDVGEYDEVYGELYVDVISPGWANGSGGKVAVLATIQAESKVINQNGSYTLSK